jgi:hypothetical protein
MNAVIGVIGCSGGVGASTLAAVLACVAQPSVLVDLDAAAGGIDVLLDAIDVPGARWSGVRVDGGRLDPHTLRGGLPAWGGCRVLAADAGPPDAEAVLQVLDAAVALGPVVLDLPRAACPERAAAFVRCDLVLLVARGDIQGVTAAHAVATDVPVPCGLVVRRGELAAEKAALAAALPLLGALPPLRAASGALDPDRLPRASVRVARGVLDGLAALALPEGA